MNRLFNALRDTADGAFVVDDELRILFWNGSAESILGYEIGDVEGGFLL
ncbi:MAG TPA: PAS domain-containing protein [Anaerolineales bacterium]|nr:PAS domain-containing protein [Anaerolineales bacterium]